MHAYRLRLNTRKAFSLVEVVIAMGIAAFALVAIIGLLSSGLRVSRDSRAELEASRVASTILATRRAVPLAPLPASPLPPLGQDSGGMQQVYLDQHGKVVGSRGEAHYLLAYRITPVSDHSSRVYLSLSHPPASNVSYGALSSAQENFETLAQIRIR